MKWQNERTIIYLYAETFLAVVGKKGTSRMIEQKGYLVKSWKQNMEEKQNNKESMLKRQ